jgi:choline kinase
MPVKQALVPASLLTSVLDGSLLAVDVRPLVVHVLHGLASAGIERAVVVLGVGAEQLVDTLKQETFAMLRIEFLWGVDINWGSSLANNIMAARTAFTADEPIMIVRSDYLFDWRLLRRMARCDVLAKGTAAFALIDSAPETLEWVSGAHCKAYCKDGHCHALVKVQHSGCYTRSPLRDSAVCLR